MKNIFKLTALAVFLCCLISCDDDEPIIPTLEVTPANLNGTWELSEWNGTPLAEGSGTESFRKILWRDCVVLSLKMYLPKSSVFPM